MIRPAASPPRCETPQRGMPQSEPPRHGAPPGFVHLCVHSNFSFLAGTRPVEDLVAAAAACGMQALALTDTDALHAVVPFTTACREAGVRPIYGVQITESRPSGRADAAAPASRGPGQDGSRAAAAAPSTGRGVGGALRSSGASQRRESAAVASPARAVLLARGSAGYAEICRLVTRRRLDEKFDFVAALGALSDEVYILASDERVLGALRGRPLLRAALPVAPGRERDGERRRIAALARRLGIETVAAQDVWFIEPGEHLVQRVLAAVRTRTTIGTLPAGAAAPRDAFFHAPAGVARVFAGETEPLAEAARIAADCRVDLALGRLRLPRFPVPPGENADGMLRRIARAGLRRRLGDEHRRPGAHAPRGDEGAASETALEAARRAAIESVLETPPAPVSDEAAAFAALSRELDVIERKGLAAYFLICWDIVRFARSRGIRSVGRGSAGNSLVSYALGITHVNPLRHNMFFERFLNPEREHLPDFDIDFGTEEREAILKYIFRRYGAGNVAMIGTFSTLRARSALRETAKALGIPEGEIAPLIRMIPFYASIERLDELARVSPRAAALPVREEPLRTLIAVARRIGGFPRHMATHPCGLVVSPEPLADLVPLQRGEKGYEITQWSMHEIEAAGLVKIDIIGQKGLAVIGEACAMAGENEGRRIDPGRIDAAEDEKTRRLVRRGETEGCFYIESPIMMQLLRQARCEEFEVLTALSSIIRPGVSNYGGKRSYLLRALGLEPVPALHPAVAEVLRDTYGCLIYQEQVIRLAVAVAGMSYAEADGLRRCMSFKNRGDETMQGYRASFMRGALGRGIPEPVAAEVFRQIASFAGYAFCKAHSASFALESFESAWCKAHYPAEFMAAVLSGGGGYYGYEEYLEEARRMGLELLPPCVHASRARHHGRGRRLRVGLMQVGGLATETIAAIVRERPFESLEDFLARAPATSAEVEALVRCGALACLGRTRPELLWELRVLRAGEGCDSSEMLRRIPAIPDYDLRRSLAAEREILDMSVSAHPLAMFEERIERLARRVKLVSSADLPRRAGERVDLVGWRVTAKATRTSDSGEEMIFVTFSDRGGRFEAIFFPRVYRRVARELFRARGPFHVSGRAESDLGAVSVVARDATLLIPSADKGDQ